MSYYMITLGNDKVKTMIFDLPAVTTCEEECKGCYALKAQKRFPNVRKKREANYDMSNSQYFVPDMCGDIGINKKYEYFRIHSSGDFYSQDYIDKWVKIVNEFPRVKFYAYTKRIDDFNFSELSSLANMNLINSVTPKGVNYGDQVYCNDLINNFGFTQCPCSPTNKVKCQVDCFVCSTKGRDKICFLKH